MRRVALAIAVFCACHKHEDPKPEFQVHVETPAAPPSVTVAAVTSAEPVPSATASSPTTPEDAKLQALREAQEFGMLGLLAVSDGGDMGNMFGDPMLLDGGGGGGGLGLGNIGTIGHGSLGTGGGSRARLREGAITVIGSLPKEVVQRIVRQNYGRFRLCYQDGLRSNSSLDGTVTTKFVIDKSGAVSKVSNEPSTTMPDTNVANCVTRAFGNLSFPQPEGGVVIVSYSLLFSPPATP